MWEVTPSGFGQIHRTLLEHTFSIVGVPERPTPEVMTTYIEAKIFNGADGTQGGYGPVYGSWIFPIALFSETLDTFQDGIPQIAIHGTHIPDQVGQELSSGCVRIPNSVINRLAEILELGTPVSIIA